MPVLRRGGGGPQPAAQEGPWVAARTLALAVALGLPGPARAESYAVDDFTRVVVSDGITATVTEGAAFAVTAEALSGDLDRLRISRRGETLEISRADDRGLFGRGDRYRFRVTVGLPRLDGIESRSGAQTRVLAAGPDLAAAAGSGASLEIEALQGGAAALSAESGASLRISGRCDHLSAAARDGASVRAEDLTCVTGALHASAGATLWAHLDGDTTVAAESGASVRLFGPGRITARAVSGAASIDQP